MRSIIIPLILLISVSVTGADLRTVDDTGKILSVVPDTSRLTVINLWATWCAPCVAEMKDLRSLSEEFGPESVTFVGLSLDDAIPGDRDATREKVERFLDRQKIDYVNLYWIGSPDPIFRHFDLEGEIPATIIIDSGGRELYRHEGVIKRETFRKQISKHLNRND